MSRRVLTSRVPVLPWPIALPEDTLYDYLEKFHQCDFVVGQKVTILRGFNLGQSGSPVSFSSRHMEGKIGQTVRIDFVGSAYIRADGWSWPWFVLRKET